MRRDRKLCIAQVHSSSKGLCQVGRTYVKNILLNFVGGEYYDTCIAAILECRR